MIRPPEKRSPGRARTGAQDHEAAAIENPFGLDTLLAHQAQTLIASHAVAPNLAAIVAAHAFGGGAYV